MAVKKSAVRTIYHIEDGPASMYEIDARHALQFKEWSETPWTKTGEKSAPVVEIADDWQDMSAQQRIALAVKLGADRKGLTSGKADEVILAEIERRAEAPGG
jgi:hypothetical protein